MSNKVKIAVISDIHFDNSDSAFHVSERKLLKSLSNCEFDFLIVNGDVSKNGEKDGFKRAKIFFKKLLKRKKNSGLTINDICFIVGNHDCDRDKISELIESENFKSFSKKYKSDSKIRNGFLNKKNLENFKPIFNNYLTFLTKQLKVESYKNSYLSKDSHWLKYLSGYRELGDNIIIFANNSCWYSDKISRGKLVLGTEIVKKNIKAIKKRKKEKVVISCLHHEISHLHWEEKYNIDSNLRSICKVSDIILTSDQHVPIQSPDYLESNNLIVATGSAHDNLNFPNSYKVLIVDLDSKNITVDNYISHNDSKKYKFKKIRPVEKKEKKGKDVYEINTSYEFRKFPFQLNLKSKLDMNEEVLLRNNSEVLKNSLDKGTIKKAENFLVKKYNKHFQVKLIKSERQKINGIKIYKNNEVLICFINLNKMILDDTVIKEYCKSEKLAHKNDFIIVPYVLIENNNFFKNKDLSFWYSKSKELEKKLQLEYIHIDNINFISHLEINKTIDKNGKKLLHNKIEKQLKIVRKAI